jgi:4-amino-4-deoxy-L-arabinose transferase-like glycosyltransferase
LWVYFYFLYFFFLNLKKEKYYWGAVANTLVTLPFITLNYFPSHGVFYFTISIPELLIERAHGKAHQGGEGCGIHFSFCDPSKGPVALILGLGPSFECSFPFFFFIFYFFEFSSTHVGPIYIRLTCMDSIPYVSWCQN